MPDGQLGSIPNAIVEMWSTIADPQAGADGRAVPPGTLRTMAEAIVDTPRLWRHRVRFDLLERQFERLFRNDVFEVWLICWDLGQDTLLHDHGGSNGAFVVASGALVEDYGSVDGQRLRTRTHSTGDSAGFSDRYLHNLVNVGPEPAVSVHVYSEPLAAMNFYCWLPSGMHLLRTVPCDNPEPDTTELQHEAARLRAAVLA